MVSAEPRRGMVYVISFMGFHKIGRTSNIEQRMRSLLPTAFPVKPDLKILMEVPESSLAESLLHTHFSSQRIHGEWFQLNDDDIEEIPKIVGSIDYSRGRLGKGKPKTQKQLSQILSNKLSHSAYAVPLRHACHVLVNLKRGRSVEIATSDRAVLRSIERKFGLKLWICCGSCNITTVTKVD